MKAIIIAAGQGNRIRLYNGEIPKPLTPIGSNSIPLILYPIWGLYYAGISDIAIVLGYKGNLIRERLGDGHNFGIRIIYVNNPEWERGSGTSVYAGLQQLKGEEEYTVLVMGDHITDPRIVKSVLEYEISGEQSVLCVDSNLLGTNITEATKVYSNGRMIGNLARRAERISEYTGIDVGVHLLHIQNTIQSLEECFARNEHSFNSSKRLLAQQGKLVQLPIDSSWKWLDLDVPDDIIVAEKLLFHMPYY